MKTSTSRIKRIAPDLGLGDPENQAPDETLRDVYSDYRNSGGNRYLEERVLKWFDPFEVARIDTKAKRRCTATFYPDLYSQDEEEPGSPLADVLRWWKKETESGQEAKKVLGYGAHATSATASLGR